MNSSVGLAIKALEGWLEAHKKVAKVEAAGTTGQERIRVEVTSTLDANFIPPIVNGFPVDVEVRSSQL